MLHKNEHLGNALRWLPTMFVDYLNGDILWSKIVWIDHGCVCVNTHTVLYACYMLPRQVVKLKVDHKIMCDSISEWFTSAEKLDNNSDWKMYCNRSPGLTLYLQEIQFGDKM